MPGSGITRGGLRLDAHKDRSTRQPVAPASTATSCVRPLGRQAGAPSAPVVSIGERVRAGQPIAQPGGEVSAWLHAPVSGTVTAIELRPGPHFSGAPTLAIVIENDGRDESM